MVQLEDTLFTSLLNGFKHYAKLNSAINWTAVIANEKSRANQSAEPTAIYRPPSNLFPRLAVAHLKRSPMKTPALALLLLVSCLPCTFAAQREFKVYGDQTLVTELKDGLPVPATKDGVKCTLPAFVARDGEFAIQFSVEAQSAIRLVSVDDVTGATEEHILLSGPQKEGSVYWMDVSTPRELSRRAAPWVFEKGDTLRVYRLKVELKERSEPVELRQPVIWNSASKKQLRKLAK